MNSLSPLSFVIIIITFKHHLSLAIRRTKEHENEHKKYEVYYDDSWQPLPLLATVNTSAPHHHRFPLRRYGIMPCDCEGLQCGCCVNTNFFSTKRSGCMNMTYDPDEFAIGMNMLWNGESVYQNSISAKNPPPACMEAPIPYLPSIQFCIRVFDIYTPGRNIHMCLNFETRLARAPILVLEFDCFQMGYDGLDYLKPNSSTTRPIIESPLSGGSGGEGSGAGGEETSGSEAVVSDDETISSTPNIPAGAADVQSSTAGAANVQSIQAGAADVQSIQAEAANVQSIKAGAANVQNIIAGAANVQSIKAGAGDSQRITEGAANVQRIQAGAANVQRIQSEAADVQRIQSEAADVQRIQAGAADVQRIQTGAADVQRIQTGAADVQRIQAGATDVQRITEGAADVQSSTAEAANVQSALSMVSGISSNDSTPRINSTAGEIKTQPNSGANADLVPRSLI